MTKLSKNLSDDIKVFSGLNSKDNGNDVIVINSDFICRFKDKCNSNECYYYASEQYRDAVVPSRLMFDIDVIVYDRRDNREFYGTLTFANDTDNAISKYSAVLYEAGKPHAKRMISVVDYDIVQNSADEIHTWTLP